MPETCILFAAAVQLPRWFPSDDSLWDSWQLLCHFDGFPVWVREPLGNVILQLSAFSLLCRLFLPSDILLLLNKGGRLLPPPTSVNPWHCFICVGDCVKVQAVSQPVRGLRQLPATAGYSFIFPASSFWQFWHISGPLLQLWFNFLSVCLAPIRILVSLASHLLNSLC